MTAIHWLQLAQADVPADDGWLAPAERAHLAGLRFPKRRAQRRLGRRTAKRAVRARLAAAPAVVGIEIRVAPDGAPEVLLGGRPAPLTSSLSHRAGGELFAGWWRRDGDLVATVVAAPPPDRPQRLAGAVRRPAAAAEASRHRPLLDLEAIEDFH